jgi:hypothetical protein
MKTLVFVAAIMLVSQASASSPSFEFTCPSTLVPAQAAMSLPSGWRIELSSGAENSKLSSPLKEIQILSAEPVPGLPPYILMPYMGPTHNHATTWPLNGGRDIWVLCKYDAASLFRPVPGKVKACYIKSSAPWPQKIHSWCALSGD